MKTEEPQFSIGHEDKVYNCSTSPPPSLYSPRLSLCGLWPLLFSYKQKTLPSFQLRLPNQANSLKEIKKILVCQNPKMVSQVFLSMLGLCEVIACPDNIRLQCKRDFADI